MHSLSVEALEDDDGEASRGAIPDLLPLHHSVYTYTTRPTPAPAVPLSATAVSASSSSLALPQSSSGSSHSASVSIPLSLSSSIHHYHLTSHYQSTPWEDPHTTDDALLDADTSPSLTLSIPDLDAFLGRCYSYYTDHGLRPFLLSRCVQLLTLAFSILFSSFLLLNIDWQAAVSCHSSASCSQLQLITWTAYSSPSRLTYLVLLYLLVFSLYWLWTLLNFLYTIKPSCDMQAFYRDRLGLNDALLPLTPWGEVVQRLVELQEREKLCTFRSLSALDITNRIMRRENFMIAMLNADVIDVSWRGWRRGKGRYMRSGRYDALQHGEAAPAAAAEEEEADAAVISSAWQWGTLLDSIIRSCVLGAAFSPDFTLSATFTSPHAAYYLRSRFYLYGVLTLLFLPFIFIFLLIFLILRHAEELHTKRSSAAASSSFSSRQWSLFSQWKLREYNELPHFFHHRLQLAAVQANDFIRQFPAILTSIICGGIAYVAGACVGVLLLLTLSGGEIFADVNGRSLLWWLAVFSAVLAIARSYMAAATPALSASATPSPAMAFASLTSFTHYHPRQWRGREHTALVYREITAMFPSTATSLLSELAALLMCPLLLLFVLPAQAERIVEYVRGVSVDVKGVGVVCKLARFDMDADVGRVDVGQEATQSSDAGDDEVEKRERRRRRRRRDARRERRRREGKEGKLEKSFLSFCINHQQWKMDSDELDDEQQQRRQRSSRLQQQHRSSGREHFLLSIAEKMQDDAQDQTQEQTHSAAAPQQRQNQHASGTSSKRHSRAVRRREPERDTASPKGGRRRRRRRRSVESVDSVSSNESLSASPSRSGSSSSSSSSPTSAQLRHRTSGPASSSASSSSSHPLSASDRHLLISFADLLPAAPLPPSLSSSRLPASSVLLSSPHGSAVLGRSRLGERWRDEMRESVTERMRERMFAVLEHKMAEEADDDEEEGNDRGDVDQQQQRAVSTAAREVEMRRIDFSRERD